MAITKQEILQSVKTLYADKGLKDKNLDVLVGIIENKLKSLGEDADEKEALTNALTEIKPFLDIVQSEADTRVSEALSKSKTQSVPTHPSNVENDTNSALSPELLAKITELEAFKKTYEENQKAENERKRKETLISSVKRALQKGDVDDLRLELAIAKCEIKEDTTIEDLTSRVSTEYDAISRQYDNYVPPINTPSPIDSDVSKNAIQETQNKIEALIKESNY